MNSTDLERGAHRTVVSTPIWRSRTWRRTGTRPVDHRAAARAHQGRQLRRRRVRRRPSWSAPASASSRAPSERTLHSHIAGVSRARPRPERRLRAEAAPAGVGAAARRHRDRVDLRPAGPRATPTSTWCKLARATRREYLTNFYGRMHDEHQRRRRHRPAAGPLATRDPRGRRRVRRRAARIALRRLPAGDGRARVAADGGPMPGRLDGGAVLVAVPADIEALRPTDPARRRRGGLRRARGARRLARRRCPGRPASTGPAGTSSNRERELAMKLTGVELRRISMPLVSPFRTSFGTETDAGRAARPRRHRPRPRAGASASR